MTPKEKAKDKAMEIFDKMNSVEDPMGNYPMCFDTAKQCALIAVDEILIEYRVLMIETAFCYDQFKYWQEVKTEIQAL